MVMFAEDKSPLKEVRVLDFTRVLAGPFCTRMMADMGAEVIKVEPPGGDVARQFEFITPEGVSGYFMQQNCGKKDLCLDLAFPEAKEIVLKLVEVCDVVVENFRPGVMARLGLSYQELLKLNPSLIMCSISAFGQRSPYANRPAGDMVIQSMSGIASLTGEPDGAPQTTGMSLSDTTGGLHAFGAISSGLYRRAITGCGQYIDVALMDCVLWQNEWASQYLFLSQGKATPTRYGNRRPILIPGNLFRGKDGWIAIVASTDPGWRNLTQAMDLPELGEDARFSTRASRIANRDELENIIDEWVVSFDSVTQVEDLLGNKGGVQCGRVQTWSEMLASSHVKDRGLVGFVDDPVLGVTSVMDSPFQIDGANVGVRGPAPLLGQHTQEILQDLLGYSEQEIIGLINANALHADDGVMATLASRLING